MRKQKTRISLILSLFAMIGIIIAGYGFSEAATAPKTSMQATYKTGQWPSYPTQYPLLDKSGLLLTGEPVVTMTDKWKANIKFTTAVPTRAAVIYFGVYDPDSILPWERFRSIAMETLTADSTQHSVDINIASLTSHVADLGHLAEHKGGVIVYRLELYDPGRALGPLASNPESRFYDRRFEFYDGKLVPTVVEGPFVSQITETSAIISWDTDKAVTGTVKVQGKADIVAAGGKATHFEVAVTGLTPGASYNYTVQNSDGTDTTTSREFFFTTAAKNTTKFSFAVLGDTRIGLGGGENDYGGAVNETSLRKLSVDAIQKGAEFLINTGDAAWGYTSDANDFAMRLRSYKDVVENVWHYIPIYHTMGNHESTVNAYGTLTADAMAAEAGSQYSFAVMFDKEGDESAEAIFAREFVNPMNGPDPDNKASNTPAGKSRPPYKENVYTFNYGNSRFIVLNTNYWFGSFSEKFGGNLYGYIMDDQMAWAMDQFDLAKADTSVEHVFLILHSPPFPNGGHVADAMWWNSGDPAKNSGWDRKYISERRDQLLTAFLNTGKGSVIMCGDEHNYSRAYITKDRNGANYPQPVWQIVNGGGGAIIEAREVNPGYWDSGVEKFSYQYAYSLIRVNGKEIRLETYNIDDQIIDSVVLKSASGEVASKTPQVETSSYSSKFEVDILDYLDMTSTTYTIAANDPLGIPAGYKTGQWPTYPTQYSLMEKSGLVLVPEPQITMTDKWKALLTFTTDIPTPAATVYFGMYAPDSELPWPRYRSVVKENLTGTSKQHSVELNLSGLTGALADFTNLVKNGGGVLVYRIELFSNAPRGPLAENPGVHFYDRRFEFYNGKLVPTVVEGPFVNQVTSNSAIISWDTDMPVTGALKVKGLSDIVAAGGAATHFEVAVTGLKSGTSYAYSVQNTNGTDTTSSAEYSFTTAVAGDTEFTFAVIGDTRIGMSGGDYDYAGSVNATALRNLLTDAYNRGAEFIIHGGDAAWGYTSSSVDFRMRLKSYKDVIEGVGHYIPIYQAFGNHESTVNAYYTYTPEGMAAEAGSQYVFAIMFDKEGDESAETIFSQEFVLPTNGPEPDNKASNTPAGKSRPPYKENVYYFDYGTSRFIVLNTNYWFGSFAEKFGGNLFGYIMDDQMAWAKEVFAKTKADPSIDNVFLIFHTPGFPNGGHAPDAQWWNGGDPAKNGGWDRTYVSERRDEIWSAFLDTGKAAAVISSDEHGYSRTLISKDRLGNSFTQPIWQIVCGAGGAAYEALDVAQPWSSGLAKFTNQYSYVIFKVDGVAVKIETYSIDGTLLDRAYINIPRSAKK